MAKKQKFRKRILAEFLFWLHTVIVFFITISGLFVSWVWVLAILVLLRLQQIAFHGCIITTLELKEGDIYRGHYYYQMAAEKFFNQRLSRNGVRAVSTAQFLFTFGLALVAAHYHFRIKL